MMGRSLGRWALRGVGFALVVCRLAAAEGAEQPELAKKLPMYPHVNNTAWYEVDAAWPQKPADVPWGQMPGVSVDAQDRVYIFTRAEPAVQVYEASGKFVRAFQPPTKASHGLRISPQGTLWLTDVGDHVVLECTLEGKVLRTLGVRGEAGDDDKHFNKPTDVAVTREGDVFISDGYGNNRVVHYDRDGKFVKAWGSAGTGPGQFNLVHAIALDSQGRLYVADRNNARVQIFDRDGKFLDQWTNVMVPWGVSVTRNDEIWVCGNSPMPWRAEDICLSCPPKDQVIMKFNPAGRALQLVVLPKGQDGQEKPGELNWLHSVAVDSHGNLYAGDIIGKRVQKFVPHR